MAQTAADTAVMTRRPPMLSAPAASCSASRAPVEEPERDGLKSASLGHCAHRRSLLPAASPEQMAAGVRHRLATITACHGARRSRADAPFLSRRPA